ncbi:ATP-binding protein [Streptomyces sp. NPDC058145]|uniref:ATP-binding protein n=1 Tax=Streptomyces sp. NPDC058145 TaxID=3346356 RepID=UPI0036E1777D
MQVLQVQLEIRPDPAEVGRARRWARSRLSGLGIGADEPLAETLVLLVSELVTNAVVHTGRPAVLRLSLPGRAPGTAADTAAGTGADTAAGTGADTAADAAGPAGATGPVASATVRLEVTDTSSRAPVPRCAGGDATGGRGLALVDCLADRWGWHSEGSGKSIWCELDRCSKSREGAALAYGGGLSAYEDFAFEAV